MSRAARSVWVFALYLLILGTTLLVVPNLLLSTFGFPPTEEVWIRVIGMLVIVLGYYYLTAVRNDFVAFFRATAQARAMVIVVFTVFVVAGLAKPMLIFFGAVDLAGAIWTAFALRRDGAKV